MSGTIERTRVNVTISNDILEWIDENIDSHRFAGRSHAVEFAVTALKEADARRTAIDKLVLELNTRVRKLEGREENEHVPPLDLKGLKGMHSTLIYE